jgi:DNA (cytosine-5)-methyltransferase 1
VKPRLLDLFSGAGGSAMGYSRAGFEVVGVDINPQPHFPFEFHQADAMTYPLDGFDAIHASPPCRDHTRLGNMHPATNTGWLLAASRERLAEHSAAWIIENVPGAPMRADYRLCGCMFGLPRLRRERWFETSWRGFDLQPPHYHLGRAVTVVGHPGGRSSRDGCYMGTSAERVAAMGIDWMSQKELSQAIPPAYTEYIGAQLIDCLEAAV